MSTHDAVMTRLRAARGEPGAAAPRVGSRLASGPLAERFTARLHRGSARVHCTNRLLLTSTLASRLEERGSRRVVIPMGLDPDWLSLVHDRMQISADLAGLSVEQLAGFDASVTGATVGIADPGIIVLDARYDQGRPELVRGPGHHICVVFAHQLVGNVDDAIAHLDPDRELTLLPEAEGSSPRHLDVVLVLDDD